MTTLKLRNVAVYALIALSIALVGLAAGMMQAGTFPGFQDGGPLAASREALSTPLFLLVTAGGMWLAANRPRLNSEELAAQVDAKRTAAKAAGVKPRKLKVVPVSEDTNGG